MASPSGADAAAQAAEILAANRYMTIATADATGRPWVSPVWFATEDGLEFLWVSSPDARHSRNVAARPEVAIVIFDSQVPVGGAAALYVSAVAKELARDERDRAIAVYSRISQRHGVRPWTVDDVRAPAKWRLYRATASERSVLGPGDERLPVTVPGG